MEEKDKLFISWTDVEDLVQELWKKIVIGSMPVNSIHGLKRGGYIPAVMLSHELNFVCLNSLFINIYIQSKQAMY